MEMKAMPGKTLSQMMEAQKELINHYIEIEGLPTYPVDINEKASQKLIKDFVRRYVEELAEAFNCLKNGLENASHNRTADQKDIAEFNMEIADCNHFLLEILIYTGISSEELDLILGAKLKESNMEGIYEEGDVVRTLLKLGLFLNNQSNITQLSKPITTAFTVFTQNEVLESPEYAGGRKISHGIMDLNSQFMWEITYNLNMAANTLSNRDHHQTAEKVVNEIQFKDNIVNTLIIIFQYFDFLGIGEISLYQSYRIKNEVNMHRIKTGY